MENKLRVKVKLGDRIVDREMGHAKANLGNKEYTGIHFKVLGLPYGGQFAGRDADGEAFYDKTDSWLLPGDYVPLTYLHGFGPDNPDDWQNPPAMIGKAMYIGKDERGHWFEAVLDATEPLAQRVEEVLNDGGEVRASSGAIAHLVRMGKAGLIDIWPVGELAVFDTNEWRQPANTLAVVEMFERSAEELEAGEATVKAADVSIEKPQLERTLKVKKMEEKIETEGLEVKPEIKPEPQKVELDYKKLVAELQPVMGDMIKSEIKKLEDAEPITAKGVPAIKKVSDLGNAQDEAKELMHYIRTGQMPANRDASKTALQEDTATEGGYLVPDDFYATIIAKRNEASVPRRAGAMVIPTSLDVINVPVQGTTASSFSIVAEEGAYNQSEPGFDQVALTIYKFALLIKISEELAADQKANLDSFLSNHIAQALVNCENQYTLTGTGSSQPQGVYVGGTAGVSSDYATTLGASEVPELYYKLAEEYTDGAVWSMRSATYALIAGLSGNNWQFAPTPAGGGWEPTLWGKPVLFSSKNAAATAGLKSIVFGNWQFYGMAEREGLTIQRNPYLYQGNGQIGLFVKVRWGGAVLQAAAFQYLTMHA